MRFPTVDPIPVPAPVWLMKALSLVTLSLHFVAVMLFIGSLGAAIWFNFTGHRSQDESRLTASQVLSNRLPVTMTFLINLGVPPLLFAQVLYGRAIYTSSVLIAVSWISVIFLLILAYWLVYKMQDAIRIGKPAWWIGLLSLLVVMGIGRIYSLNMTLMLKPEVWQQMYAANPHGLGVPPADPTITPRWLFIMTGGFIVGGLWLMLLANMTHLPDSVRNLFKKVGATMPLIGAIPQVFCGYQTFDLQSSEVQASLTTTPIHRMSALIYLVAVVLIALVSLRQLSTAPSRGLAIGGIAFAFLSSVATVVYRDGIRDYVLFAKGFNVWDRTEVSNWSVIGLFLLLFVAMLGLIGWLLSVVKRSTPPEEQVAL